jgi:hypothetical protein
MRGVGVSSERGTGGLLENTNFDQRAGLFKSLMRYEATSDEKHGLSGTVRHRRDVISCVVFPSNAFDWLAR